MKLRKEVIEFAEAMEKELRRKDEQYGKKGWKELDNKFLTRKLTEEFSELVQDMVNYSQSGIMEESPHVGTIAMMIYDNNKKEDN